MVKSKYTNCAIFVLYFDIRTVTLIDILLYYSLKPEHYVTTAEYMKRVKENLDSSLSA